MAPSVALRFLAIAGLLSTGLTAPSPVQGRDIRVRQADAAELPTATAIGPPGGSGELRGPESLAGFGSSSNQISSPDTQIPSSDYQLAPGQTVDQDTGVYIDLSSVENPQPIRGPPTDSPTDPGPR